MISEHRVTSAFFNTISKAPKNALFDVMASTSYWYKCKKKWEDAKSEIAYEEKVYDMHLTELQNLFQGCLHCLRDDVNITDIDHLSSELTERVKNSNGARSFIIRDITLPKHWGELFHLLGEAEELHELAFSTIFLNICRSVLKNTRPYLAEDIQTRQAKCENVDAESDERNVNVLENLNERVTCVDLAKTLSSTCLPVFTKHTRSFLDGNMSIHVDSVRDMMSGIEETEVLGKEISILEKFFDCEISTEMKTNLRSFVELPLITNRSNQLQTILTSFDLSNDKSQIHSALEKIHDLHCNSGMTLLEFVSAMETVSDVINRFEDEDWNIVSQLSESKELITFLKSVVGEDLRNLIDAVEEYSEQSVNESVVSDLIDVKRYLEPLLGVKSADELVEKIPLNREISRSVKKIPEKLEACLDNIHSLKNLYNNVANRGEMTKEIIANALEKGTFSFHLDNKSEVCQAMLSYQRGTAEVKYGLEALSDLRSRALLLVNKQKFTTYQSGNSGQSDFPGTQNPELMEFVHCITEVNSIVDLCSLLLHTGHFQFKKFAENLRSLSALKRLQIKLQQMYDSWREILDEARSTYYFLNFVHSRKLWDLEQFFTGASDMTDDIELLLRYIHPDIHLDRNIQQEYEKPT